MSIDDHLVITSELLGMRLLARLNRPKIHVVQEDLPGASCMWTQGPQGGGHRDLVRLCPGSGVPLRETLGRVRASSKRQMDGHLEIRGAASNLVAEASFLTELGGREILTLPRALMARPVGRATAEAEPLAAGLTVQIADDPESLAELRVVVAQSFAGATEDEARQADVEADFFHAPGVMAYLAVRDQDQAVISTGSILIVQGAANVWSVATSPSARGRGAATAIMQAVCLEAAQRGASVVVLRTTDELARPDGLYGSLGFELVGHEHIWELDDIDELPLPLL